jgi:hypothetical protein
MRWQIDEVGVEAVDNYRAHKVRESEARARAIERGKPQRNVRGQILRPLSPGSINRTIGLLQWVLSVALEYGHVAENPRSGAAGGCASAGRLRSTSTPSGRSRRCSTPRPELDRDPGPMLYGAAGDCWHAGLRGAARARTRRWQSATARATSKPCPAAHRAGSRE